MQTIQSQDVGMKDFWEVYDSHQEQISAELLEVALRNPEFEPVLRAMPPERLSEVQRRSHELQRRAILLGEWPPYLDDLSAQGAHYAQMGVSFPAWFELVGALRERLAPHLVSEYGHNPARLLAAVNGMDKFVDTAMGGIGQAYINTKEELIRQQQEALRELSTPVLPVREGLLILPIIGMIDTQRARQFTEQLLQAIRMNRAKVVVIDITGVPAVDTKVANHLAQTVEAARLMGTTAVITGLSAGVALTLVTLGIDLSKLHTVGDLRGGIEEANRLLGYKVVNIQTERT